jgi:hypothetical protein
MRDQRIDASGEAVEEWVYRPARLALCPIRRALRSRVELAVALAIRATWFQAPAIAPRHKPTAVWVRLQGGCGS